MNLETLAASVNEDRQNKKHNTTQKPKPMSGTQVTLMTSDDKVYSIQLYGTKFVGNMRSVSSCLRVLCLLPIVKLSATILWKERLNSDCLQYPNINKPTITSHFNSLSIKKVFVKWLWEFRSRLEANTNIRQD
jgi:hypothetical protein